MSTNGLTSWAVDLAEIGAIYPFQGTEVPLYIAGLAFWIWFHWAQLRNEKVELQHEMDADASGEATRAAINAY
ncbi:hypothetical protein [Lutibaculum baratangense]|uniref:Uncharacterized protein n=1 Tax=Lutibaculum baratangense AMV1 TaxID=631454 RepID=V4R0Z4_9HYPH|nr:hypothetical protein [Lutibaculum baratangense]ESR25672.1 hypothetical protein N177_1505 [Lutibaculum baratangense AMV1]